MNTTHNALYDTTTSALVLASAIAAVLQLWSPAGADTIVASPSQRAASSTAYTDILGRSFGSDSRDEILSRSARSYSPRTHRKRATRVEPGSAVDTARLDRTERYKALIDYYSDLNDIEPALVKAIVYAESGGDARAVSPAGAAGLMQLMPATARQLGVRDRFNAEQSISSGTRYLRSLMDEFGSTEMALWAYNAGPGNVTAGRMPAETRNYVPRVLRLMRMFMQRQSNSRDTLAKQPVTDAVTGAVSVTLEIN